MNENQRRGCSEQNHLRTSTFLVRYSIFSSSLSMALFAGIVADPLEASESQAPKFALCCASDNDLLRVLQENGAQVDRFDRPAEAVRGAEEGAGVLILADGYPTTDGDAEEARVDVRDPVNGTAIAQVRLRPVALNTIEEHIVSGMSANATRKREAYATQLAFG